MKKEKAAEYKIRRSKKTKRISISINSDLKVLVSAPLRASERSINFFVKKKSLWIKKTLAYYEKEVERVDDITLNDNRRKIIKNFIVDRLEYFNNFYGYSYNKIFVKNHKSRWGSCSSAKNLNFNYRLALLTPDLADYIIVHELCHLAEMNHSERFWSLVEKTVPNHKERRRKLKKIVF